MIVTELIQIQKQRELSNGQFAESLGIHKISWYRNKRTKIIGADVLLRAFEIYPELRETFISSFDSTNHSLTHHSKQGISFRSLSIAFLKGLKKLSSTFKQ